MSDLYTWIKALHIISVIAWMAGLLYLPRLFVYHCGVSRASEASETFKIMERRLLKAIMTPAMVATWVFAVAMLYLNPEWLTQGWFHGKLLLVIGMSGMHGVMSGWHGRFAEDRNVRPARFYRLMNEVPTVLMIVIVLLVVLKPF